MSSSNGIPVDYGRCSVTGKVKYISKSDAKRIVKILKGKGNSYMNNISVFHCDHCDYYHTGTRTIKGELVDRNTHRNIRGNKKL